MPEVTTKPHELEELQEQQRGLAQITQAQELTAVDHIRKKLGIMRSRLRKTYQDEGQIPANEPGEGADDMQILARDITFNGDGSSGQLPSEPPPTAETPKPKWNLPLSLAVLLGLGMGTPLMTGILMAPKIISAFHQKANQPPARPEYAPILLPGKPEGVK